MADTTHYGTGDYRTAYEIYRTTPEVRTCRHDEERTVCGRWVRAGGIVSPADEATCQMCQRRRVLAV